MKKTSLLLLLTFYFISLTGTPAIFANDKKASETQNDRLHILLTNDDGIDAPGILAVEKALLAAGHRVSVIAPASQQSGASSSITGGNIVISSRGKGRWAIAGRPADAVRIALGYLLADDRPDLVISGA
ncbi:MAG: 5'/3'-nucleotidase SurE, partial [Gammaproteobacteria bacterium]|nr:5'/3'-nucleotidase SurE [Gammaproteobacteria bacterium]